MIKTSLSGLNFAIARIDVTSPPPRRRVKMSAVLIAANTPRSHRHQDEFPVTRPDGEDAIKRRYQNAEDDDQREQPVDACFHDDRDGLDEQRRREADQASKFDRQPLDAADGLVIQTQTADDHYAAEQVHGVPDQVVRPERMPDDRVRQCVGPDEEDQRAGDSGGSHPGFVAVGTEVYTWRNYADQLCPSLTHQPSMSHRRRSSIAHAKNANQLPMIQANDRDVNGRASESSVEWMAPRSEEHTSELQSRFDLVCRLL